MKKEARQILNCLCAYRKGENTAEVSEPLSPEEWGRLYSLAAVHKLLPVVFETLHNDPEFCLDCGNLAGVWKQNTIMQVIEQTGCTQKLLELTHALDQAGVPYAVVKGVVCRRMYAKPDLRPSGDEDLFIPPHERTRCGEIFEQHGLTAVPAPEEHDVTHWQDPRTGLHIELHTRLFATGWAAEQVLNEYFSEQLSRVTAVCVEQTSVKTLEPTAHMLFLIAHAMKHFIAGGFGIRTLADILTFCEQYQEQIDWPHLWSMLETIHGRVFIQELFAIGQAYLGFERSAWDGVLTDAPAGSDLLDDMLDAGIYGQTSMDRRHSAALVLQSAKSGQDRPSLRAALFPPANQMQGRYPILRKVPVLLPVMWARRIICYGLELLRGRGKGNSPRETLAMGKKRTEMMIKYGIIPQAKTEDP